ncbi:MAG: glutamine-hydrolyzing carbamoyl-phosphate synthase small subunit [Cardiobacteriaceae bacterium]|nr:glutamine-hydrolyzing carbamoyl-phosphate synthase small subunit [Cardiobacteriaceae bacterium]
METEAILALADGSIFRGISIGATGIQCGELVFNTAMTGYQEILTDPSYSGQIVTLTYPHIGNVGANGLDIESGSIGAAGLVVRDYPKRFSSWRGEESLGAYLQRNGIIGISDVDTRELTRRLRTRGAQNACLMAGEIDEAKAVELARNHPSMAGLDLASDIGTKEQSAWAQSIWEPRSNTYPEHGNGQYHVVAYDFGIKSNILRLLVAHDCRVTLVPANTSLEAIKALCPDGVFLSNGPGDPEPMVQVIETIKGIIDSGLPTFGICLGHQLIGLASGAKTVKMKFGHHGANHPVQEVATGKVLITSQNHGFAVDEETLPEGVIPTHRSLFDGSLQGLAYEHKPVFSFQGHPEASPGPRDVEPLFAHFVDLMKQHRAA